MSNCTLTIKNELLKNFLGQNTFDSYEQLEEALGATVREKQIIPISQGSKQGFHKIELAQNGRFYLLDLGDPDGPFEISLGNLVSEILLLFNFEPSVLDSYVKSAIDEYYNTRPTKENRPKTPADTDNNIDHLRSISRYIKSVLPDSQYIKQLDEIINEYDNYVPEPFGISEEPYYFYPYQYSRVEDGVFQETDDIEKARLDFGRALNTGSFRLDGSNKDVEIYVRIEPDTLQNAQSAPLEESQLNAVLVPYVRINDQWQRVFISKNQPDEYSLSITVDPENARTVGFNKSPRFTFHIPNLTNSMYPQYLTGNALARFMEVASALSAIKQGVSVLDTPSQYYKVTPVKIHKHNAPKKVRQYSRVSEFEKGLEDVQIGVQIFQGDVPVGFPTLMVGNERVPAYPAPINPKYRDQILTLVRRGVVPNFYSDEDLIKVRDYLNKVYSYKNSDFRFEINGDKLVILSSIKIENDRFIPLKKRQSIDFSQFEEVIKKGRVAIDKNVIDGTFNLLIPNDANNPYPFTEQEIDGTTWSKEHIQTSAAKSIVNEKLVYEPFYTFTFNLDTPYRETPDPNLPPAPGDFKPVYEDSSLEDFLAKQWGSLEVNEDTQRLYELIIGMASDKLEGYQIKFVKRIGKGVVNTTEKIITIDPESNIPVVLIEEISHALTSDWLQANEDTPEFKRLLEITNKIYFQYDGAKTDMDRVIEFLAKLGDPEVAEKLKHLKGKRQNRNLLDEFTDIIKAIFNRMFKGFSKSIYQETAELYVKIATSPVNTLPAVEDVKIIKAGGREITIKRRSGPGGLTPPKTRFGADYDSVLNEFKKRITSEYGKIFLDNALQSFTGDLVELLGKVEVQPGVVENMIPALLNGKLDFEMVYNSLLDIYEEQLEVLSESDPTNPRVAYLGFILDGDNPDIFKEIFKEENKVFSIKRDKTLAERLEIGSDEEVRDEEDTSEEVKTAADETDVERMGAAPKDEYKREPNKFNFDEADRKVKALIQLLPQIERNEDGTTKFYLREKVNEEIEKGVSSGRFFEADMLGDQQRYVRVAETSLGSLKLNDTIVTWSNLTRIFANAFSIEDMVENANHFRDKVNQEVPEFYALRSFLDTDNIKDLEHNQLLVKFEAAFKRFENPLYIVLVDEGKRNIINESADIFLTVKKVVNSNLRAKVLEEGSKYEKAYDEETDTLNLTEIIPEFTDLDKLPNAVSSKLKFLSALGMDFSPAMVTNNQIAFDNFAHTVFNFLKATGWENVPVEISDYITKDQPKKSGGIEKGLNNLFKITFTLQHEYTPFSYTIMNPNAEGEAQSTFSIPNSILQDAAILNSTLYKGQPLTVNFLETLIPRSANPSFRSTLTFKRMFNADGTRNVKSKIQVVNWNGEKITQEGTASEGRLNVNLDDSAKVYFDFIGLMTKGLHENTRAQVSTTSYAFRLEDYRNNQEYPIAFGTVKAILKDKTVSLGRESVLDLFVGYHNAEIEERKMLAKGEELAPPMFSKMFSEGELFRNPEYQSLINQKIETNEDKEKFGQLLYEYIDTITKEYTQEFSKAGGFDGLRDGEGNLHSKIQTLLDDNKAEDADLNKRAVLATYAINSTILHIEEVLLFQGSFQRVSLPKIKYFKRSNTVQSTRIPITGSEKLREYINTQLRAASFASSLNFDPFQLGDKAKTSVLADIEESVSDEVRDQMIDGYKKSAIEYYKRAGIKFVRGGKEDTAQVIQEMAEKVAESYTKTEDGKGKVNIPDGQGHINPDAYVGFLLGVGGDTNLLTAHKALALDLIYNQDIYFTEEEIKRFGIRDKDSLTEQELQEMREGMELLDKGKVVFPSLKWTHRGSVEVENSVAKEVLDKFSLFPLYIQYVYNKPHLKNLALSMMETGMAYTKFISGSKMDNFGVVDYEALLKEGKDLATALQGASYEILTNNFGEQIKTPTYAKVSNTYGSQFRKLILQGLISVKESDLVDSWGMANREFSRFIEDKVLKEFGIQDKDFTNLDLKKISKVLKEQATSRELDDNVLNFLKAMEAGTYDKMESTFNQKEVQNLIANIVKRIAIQKLQGAQLIQVSSALDHYGEDRLKWYSLGNPAECKVSMQGDFMNLLNLPEVRREAEKLPKEDRTVLAKTRILNRLLKNKDFVEKHKDSLTVVTYRIPTQGHNSMDVFRIKEFLPHFQAPQIVLPPEAVVKSGTDYDYDKASAIFPSIDSRGNYQKIENIEGFDKTLDQIKEEYKANKEQLWEDFKEEFKTKKSEFYEQLNFDFLKSEQKLLNADFLENQARIEQLQEEREVEPDPGLRKAIDLQLKVLFEIQEEIRLEQVNISQELSTLREDLRLSKSIEYQVLLNNLQTQKTNLHAQYVDDINFLKSYSAQSIYQNRLLEDSIGILLHPLNFFKLITPNSNELIFTEYLDEFLENLYGKGFRSEPSGSDIVRHKYNFLKFKVVKGKDLLGIVAASNTFFTLLQTYGTQINSSYNRKVNNKFSLKQTVRTPLISPEHKLVISTKDGISLKQDLTEDNQFKSEVISQLINVTVDMPGNDKFGFTNFNYDNFGAALYLIQTQGVTFSTLLHFFHQPVVFKYEDQIRKMSKGGKKPTKYEQAVLLAKIFGVPTVVGEKNKTSKQLNTELYRELNKWEQEFERENLAGNIKPLEEIFNGQYSLDNLSDFDKAVLAYYIKVTDQASIMREVDASINFDRNPDNLMMKYIDRVNTLAEVQKAGLIDSKFIPTIFNESAISGLYTNPILGAITNKLFPALFHKTNAGVFNILAKAASNKEVLFNKVTNDFMSSIVQNFATMKFEGEENVSVKEIGDRYLKGEGKNKLISKARELNKEFKAQGKDLRLLRILTTSVSARRKDVANVQIFLGFEKATVDVNRLIREFQELLEDPREDVRDFARALVAAGITQAGYQKSPLFFSNLIPTDFIAPIIQHAVHNYMLVEKKGKYAQTFMTMFKYFEKRLFDAKGNLQEDQREVYRYKDYTIPVQELGKLDAAEQPTGNELTELINKFIKANNLEITKPTYEDAEIVEYTEVEDVGMEDFTIAGSPIISPDTPVLNSLPVPTGIPTFTYAGIGSRETPQSVLEKMTEASKFLEQQGFILQTGFTFKDKETGLDEEGADKAFSDGATNKILFGPDVIRVVKNGKQTSEQYKDAVLNTSDSIVDEIHPAPSKLKAGARKLMARNTNQIFGKDLNSTVDFVLFWAEESTDELRPKGGTGQAVEIARRKGIPTINMRDPNWRQSLLNVLNTIRAAKEQKTLPAALPKKEDSTSKNLNINSKVDAYKQAVNEIYRQYNTTTPNDYTFDAFTEILKKYNLYGKLNYWNLIFGTQEEHASELKKARKLLSENEYENFINEKYEDVTLEFEEGRVVFKEMGKYVTIAETFSDNGLVDYIKEAIEMGDIIDDIPTQPAALPASVESSQQLVKTYSGKIEKLQPNQIFVFGSNPLGVNGNPSKGTGGAALVAYNIAGVKQGEKMDNKLSDSGKAWGITTVTAPGAKRSKTPDEIKEGIKKLYDFATKNTDKEFLIAYQGTEGRNLNGYSNQELAEMFAAFEIPSNIVFEEEFNKLVRKNLNQIQTDEQNESFIKNDVILQIAQNKDETSQNTLVRIYNSIFNTSANNPWNETLQKKISSIKEIIKPQSDSRDLRTRYEKFLNVKLIQEISNKYNLQKITDTDVIKMLTGETQINLDKLKQVTDGQRQLILLGDRKISYSMYKDEQSNIRLSGQRGFGVHTRTAASLDAVANIQDLILKEGEKIKITSSDEIYLSDKPDELQAGISFTTESGIKSLKKSVLKEFLTTLNENDKNILLHTNLLDNIYLELYSSLLSSNAFLTNLQDAYDKIIDLFNEYNKEDFTKTTEYDYLKAIDSTLQNKENKQNECGPGF